MARHSLGNLSDNVLLSRLHKLVAQEKQTTLSILVHLAEVDRRDLYLAYGFSSLFDYCVGALSYSRSAAGRRIASARCLRRYPDVYTLLESGEANLTTIGHIASILNDENKDLLLSEILGKTERQVESIVARYKPPVAYRDRVRPVRVAVPELGQNANNRRNSLILNSRTGSSNRTNCGIVDPPGQEGQGPDGALTTGACGAIEPQQPAPACGKLATPPGQPQQPARPTGDGGAAKTELGFLIQFLANEEFMAKLDEVKSLLSNKMPNGTFESLFETLMNEFIERHSPEKRTQRREKRKEQSKQSGPALKKQPQTSESPSDSHNAPPQKQTRHIPAALRDKIFVRDNAQCTYVGKNGKRCGSTHSLQIDHIKPFAMGGRNTAINLRLLCGRHNRSEAKRLLGEQVMTQFRKRE